MFIALDLETTGLDPVKDRILQVAWQLLDNKLEPLDDPQDYAVSLSHVGRERLMAEPYVREMHRKTGLLARLDSGPTLLLEDVDDALVGNVDEHWDKQETIHLLGASVHFDRSFIHEAMPATDGILHYRILDTSSLKLVGQAAGIDFSVENPQWHNAAFDIQESIEIARRVSGMLHEYTNKQWYGPLGDQAI